MPGGHVEQDLAISRAVAEMFRVQQLGARLARRGGSLILTLSGGISNILAREIKAALAGRRMEPKTHLLEDLQLPRPKTGRER